MYRTHFNLMSVLPQCTQRFDATVSFVLRLCISIIRGDAVASVLLALIDRLNFSRRFLNLLVTTNAIRLTHAYICMFIYFGCLQWQAYVCEHTQRNIYTYVYISLLLLYVLYDICYMLYVILFCYILNFVLLCYMYVRCTHLSTSVHRYTTKSIHMYVCICVPPTLVDFGWNGSKGWQ